MGVGVESFCPPLRPLPLLQVDFRHVLRGKIGSRGCRFPTVHIHVLVVSIKDVTVVGGLGQRRQGPFQKGGLRGGGSQRRRYYVFIF